MKVEFIGMNNKEAVEKRLQVVASAGCLSRFDGTVTQVLESHQDYEKNLKLAKAVVGYGHKSISEHDYLVFALEDVTPIIEQILIGYRLTSFTVKSRRNVDFRSAGFYIPEFRHKNGKVHEANVCLQEKYKVYMQSLFDQYARFVDLEIPIEDCRYVLPYSYHSNFIMGCDANEFLNITSDMLYGKNAQISEVFELGKKFAEFISTHVPYFEKALENEKKKEYYRDQLAFLDDYVNENRVSGLLEGELLKKVEMLDYTENADGKVLVSALMARYQCSSAQACELLSALEKDNPNISSEIMQGIIHNKNQRELEQVIFSYQIPISLAVLTHLTRHRLHSLMIPEFTKLRLDAYVTPQTIAQNHKMEYDEIFEKNKEMREYFASQDIIPEDLIYFLLSGNACNVVTTMNARVLEWISRMRTCSKAQWEIQDVVGQMTELASSVAPLIGMGLGPNCKVFGECFEGKDSCTNRKVVVKKRN